MTRRHPRRVALPALAHDSLVHLRQLAVDLTRADAGLQHTYDWSADELLNALTESTPGTQPRTMAADAAAVVLVRLAAHIADSDDEHAHALLRALAEATAPLGLGEHDQIELHETSIGPVRLAHDAASWVRMPDGARVSAAAVLDAVQPYLRPAVVEATLAVVAELAQAVTAVSRDPRMWPQLRAHQAAGYAASAQALLDGLTASELLSLAV
jgi:hypothetical protein